MSGNLKQIDAGSGSVVGVNNLNEVFILIDNIFTKISGSLKHFSVGPAGQLGVNTANNIFKFQSGNFIQFPGLLKQVDAGGDQIIAGVNMNDDIFCLNMDANDKWPSSTTPWDVSNNVCSGSGVFVNIPGLLSMIEVATDGSVFGVNYQGNLYQRTGVTLSNPVGTDWISMVACPNGHKHVSFDLGVLDMRKVNREVKKAEIQKNKFLIVT
ncbi:fish-egg lectin-like [Sinocyclocheilus grahami]|uniref:fish-egg lectin-like n=1 Tax=Sinocyclocheilus grahami TaxID=75366 RepID=UPI0007ACE5FF|nr:PREDICTED: fish-egg lectin-like [Sinocyclocheilus grahami]